MSDRNNESVFSEQESGSVIRTGEKRKAEDVTKQSEEVGKSQINKRQHICSENMSVNLNLGNINLEDDHVVNVDQDQQVFWDNEEKEEIQNAQCSKQTKSESHGSPENIDLTTEIINLRRENKLLKEKEDQQKKIIEDMHLQIQKLENSVSGQTAQMLQPQVLPIVCRYLDIKTLLKCRLVCQKWCDGVESFLEYCFSHGSAQKHLNFNTRLQHQNQPNILSVNTTELKKLENRYVFTQSTMLEEFLQKMKDVKKNAFLGRAVTYQKLERDADAYWKAVQKSLWLYGIHLHTIKLVDFRAHNLSFVSFYQIFEASFPYLLNLKDLVVCSNIRFCVKPAEERKQRAILLKYIARKPLKTLHHLSSLEFMCEIVEIQHAILRACPEVKRFASGVFTTQTGILLKNRTLKEVHVKPFVWKLNWHHDAFQGLLQIEEDLEMLSITTKQRDRICIQEVFCVLSRFKNLSALELDSNIKFGKLEANFEYNSINMQNLTVKTLFVQPCANMKNTEQLTTEPFYSKLFSYFPNVKSLYIKEEPTLPELIPWNGGIDSSLKYPLAKHDATESLYSSQVWDLLKFLKSVKMEVETRAFGKQETIVRTRTWTRNGYQAFRNNMQK